MDERLVHQVQEGDQEALRSLVITEHARLLRVAQGVLRDPHVAEDAVQHYVPHGFIIEGELPPAPEIASTGS